jgi:hypothetical protein
LTANNLTEFTDEVNSHLPSGKKYRGTAKLLIKKIGLAECTTAFLEGFLIHLRKMIEFQNNLLKTEVSSTKNTLLKKNKVDLIVHVIKEFFTYTYVGTDTNGDTNLEEYYIFDKDDLKTIVNFLKTNWSNSLRTDATPDKTSIAAKQFLEDETGRATTAMKQRFIQLMHDFTSQIEDTTQHISPYDETVGLGINSSCKIRFNKGKYYIDTKKLNTGVLEIRYSSNDHLIGLKSLLISKKMQNEILSLLKGGDCNIASLPADEKHLMKLISAKFGKNLEPDTELNDEFNVLKGEWLAGNNSIIIARKLRHMIHLLADTGKISRMAAQKFISELGL